MAKVDNQYSGILNIMRQEGARDNTPGIATGIIKSIEPLIVTIGGLDLDENFVSLSEYMKPHMRKTHDIGYYDVVGPWHPVVTSDAHGHQSTLDKIYGDGWFKGKDYVTDYGFYVGDTVLALSTDDAQHYYIIAKIGGCDSNVL